LLATPQSLAGEWGPSTRRFTAATGFALKKWNKTAPAGERPFHASCLNYEKGAGKVEIERAHGKWNFDMIKRCCPG
jgi:hypothetical protein